MIDHQVLMNYNSSSKRQQFHSYQTDLLALFAIVYLGMSFNTDPYIFFSLFFIYGVYASATEGISKAWISIITDKKDTATAIGTYSGFQSICTMLASSFTGLIWYNFGATVAFIMTAVMTVLIIYYFLTIPSPTTTQTVINEK